MSLEEPNTMADRNRTVRKGIAIPIAICAFAFGISGVEQASAQGNEQERTACRHDVRRFCQAELQRNPGDMLSIAGCLQANRSRISRTCRGALANHGQ
jgi:hypothetical protein